MKPRRADPDDERRGEYADQGDDDQGGEKHAGNVVHQHPGLLLAPAVLVFGQHRHERLRERPLGEQAAQ